MSYPVLKPEMIEPRDAKITTALAKKIFRMYMTETGYLHREELSEHTSYFADEIRQHEELLKEEVRSAKESFGEEVSELRREITATRKILATAREPEIKEELEADLAAAEEELQQTSKYILKAEADLQSFKEDKRQFVVDYINRQVQR
jgi:hypothetical protein